VKEFALMTLLEDIQKRTDRETRLAIVTQITGLALMYIAVGASAAVAICGFIDKVDRHVVGALALVPGFIGLLATTIKFDDRSQWHYEKRDALDALARRFQFEMPQPPTPDQVALISGELTKLNKDFNKLWYAKISLNWAWTKGSQKKEV
jgi:hypothetical protein